MNIIFLGAPGSGKGTQAARISNKLNIPAISTGNMIRDALANETDMGKKAKSFVESGKLVPDEVVIGIIKERLADEDCKNGFILDGFPRNIPQAEALEKMDIIIDKVVNMNIEDDGIIERMAGRRVCKKCGTSFHLLYNKPKKENICDLCGSELIFRKDDEPETVLNRLKVYHEQTEPLIGFYEKQGKLVNVLAKGNLDDITDNVLKGLEA